MYTGFNLSLHEKFFDDKDNSIYIQKGQRIYETVRRCTLINLKNIINQEIIDGDILQNMWFPTELFGNEPFVFISHSHKDEKTAIQLAGYLSENFGIKSFIDSCVWGHMATLNELLNNCDKSTSHHCHGCECTEFSSNLSYVHMMLASALMTMIDKCECIFFLNTSSSINLHNKTESPWIYHELNVASTIQKRTKTDEIFLEHALGFKQRIEFTPNFKNMVKINEGHLNEWKHTYISGADPFIQLYKICEKR